MAKALKPKIAPNPSRDLRDWKFFPDLLPGGRFRGLENRDDQTQLQGAFVLGQNMKIGSDSLPVTRDGYEVLGTEATNATPIQRAWAFETRDGATFELKAFSTFIYYWLRGYSTDWALLKGGFTPGLEFGYGNIGETGGEFNSFFDNGVDPWYQFNGAYATVLSVTVNTITMSESGTFTSRGFYAGTGTTAVSVAGVERTYSGGEGTATLTGVSSTVGINPGDIIVQTPRAVSFTAGPAVSKVITAHDGRLHARSDIKKSVWNYSKLDNPDDWTTGANDGDGGTKDVEFGGGIVAFGKLNQTILALKNRIIKSLNFVQSGDRVDIPRYTTLIPADDKSTTLGGVTQRSTFATPYGLVFTTPDKRMVLLTGITANEQPQYVILSELIQPIFDRGIHDDAAGICVDNIIWYAFKSDINSSYNDVVIRGDMTRPSIDSLGRSIPIRWDTPTVGWSVKDWTAVYNPDTGKNEVHWHSALNSSSYKVISEKADNTNSYSCSIRSWAETFGAATRQKLVDRIWVEIRMSENTEVLSTVLYDENGVTGQEEHVLDGDSTRNEFSTAVYNPFGLNPFGSQKFGSEPEAVELPLYRFEIMLKANIRFFNISLQFSTDDPGQNFQIVRFGFRLKELIQETDRKYMTS